MSKTDKDTNSLVGFGDVKARADRLLVEAADSGPKGEPSAEWIRYLAGLGEVEDISLSPDHFMLQIAPVKDAEHLRITWQRIQRALGKSAKVYPVIVGEDGMERLPSGSIVVRFEDAPPEGEIDSWASAHGLQLKARNRYIPRQATFTQTDPSKEFLLDLLKDVDRKQPGLEKVWPETYSQFQRE